MPILKRKKKRKYILIIIILLYLIFAYTWYYTLKNNYKDGMVKLLFIDDTEIVNKLINDIFKIDFNKPYTLFNESIIGYSNVGEDLEYANMEELEKVSSYISDPNDIDIENPIVYIYNSHQLENYKADNILLSGITPNVLMASYLLKEKLNSKGISAVVEETNLTEFLRVNNWDYTYSYAASRIFILDKKNNYDSIKYFIDIHRDSVKKNVTYLNFKGKDYAKILFVVGLEHNNYKKNLELANKLDNLFNKYYPGLSRGVYQKQGANVNGIYNQDISPNAMLIEVGGVDSNINEVLNSVSAISDVLTIYIKENETK